MDGLLNTCHASLINIQSSPSRKSARPCDAMTMTTRQVEGRLIFIGHRCRPRWHLRGLRCARCHRTVPPLSPSPPLPPPPQSEFVMVRDASRKILEYDDARTDRRLTMSKRMDEGADRRRGEGARVYLSFSFTFISTPAGSPTRRAPDVGIPDAGRFVPFSVICAFNRGRHSGDTRVTDDR